MKSGYGMVYLRFAGGIPFSSIFESIRQPLTMKHIYILILLLAGTCANGARAASIQTFLTDCDAQSGIGPGEVFICGSETFDLYPLLLGPVDPGGSWTGPVGWSGNGTPNGPINPDTDSFGTYVYSVEGTDGCTSETAIEVVVNDIGILGYKQYCDSSPVNLFDILGNNSLPLVGIWVAPDGSIVAQGIVVDPLNAESGNYILLFEDINGCKSSGIMNVQFGLEIIQPPIGDGIYETSDPTEIVCFIDLLDDPEDIAQYLGGVWIVETAGGMFLDFYPNSNPCVSLGPYFQYDTDLTLWYAAGIAGCALRLWTVQVHFQPVIPPPTNGGILTASGNLTPCNGDGGPDPIQLSVTGNSGNSRFGLLNTANDIIAQNTTGLFNMENYPPGNYKLGHLSYGDGFILQGLTNVSQFQGDYDASNLINVISYAVDGGTISAGGATTVCGNDGIPSVLNVTVTGASGPNKRWVVLNSNFSTALAISPNPNFNFDNFPPGTYRLVHASYGFGVNLSQIDPLNIQGCVDGSNAITVNVVNCAGSTLQVQPNPTSGPTAILFQSADEHYTSVEIYDLTGRLVKNLFSGIPNPGQDYRFQFDGSYLPNGVYVCKLVSANTILMEKFMIAR